MELYIPTISVPAIIPKSSMLIVRTIFKIFRFSRRDIEGTIGSLDVEDRIISASYALGLEIEAALRDEEFSVKIMNDANIFSETIRGDEVMTFVCSDGEFECPYKKETLARHSTLIRDYITDYPEATSIDMSRHSKDDVKATIWTMLEFVSYPLTPGRRYVLQMLNPPTDLYQLLFGMPTNVLSIVRGMTQEERDDVLDSYDLMSKISSSDIYRPLPNCGGGDAIALAFPSVRVNLNDRAPELCETYPSFYYYQICDSEDRVYECKQLLLTADFNDYCGIATDRQRSKIIETIIETMSKCTWEETCILLAMIGIRHPLLHNEDVDRCAPYQVTISPDLNLGNTFTWSSLVECGEKGDLSMGYFSAIVRPYFFDD